MTFRLDNVIVVMIYSSHGLRKQETSALSRFFEWNFTLLYCFRADPKGGDSMIGFLFLKESV